MPSFTATLFRFDKKGEKTGWTYFDIPMDIATALSPGNKKSFRVKGTLDDFAIAQVATVPMGEGEFIIAFNADMRKGTKKKEGDKIAVVLEIDTSERLMSQDLIDCLSEDPNSLDKFLALPLGHRNYYSNWIESAKGADTKADRIRKTLFAMQHDMQYGEMIRYFKSLK
jgi:Domain of unknown function (DUF1905)/Bacteriocin-protection, YdeI or OmpD-Associated